MQGFFSEIYSIYEEQRKYETDQCLNFNIFSILNIERREVDTHSLFLYELLNPYGSHNHHSLFLKSFLNHVLQLNDYGSILNHGVKREDPTKFGRRIDFTIETTQYQIAIEMKIDADDQTNQLYDYYMEMNERARNLDSEKQNIKIYYLTLFGNPASKKSLNNLNNNDYECISFCNDILRWINHCIDISYSKAVVKELLNQYKVLLEIITNQNTNLQAKTMKIITQNKKNFIAAYETYKSFEGVATKLETSFWYTLTNKISQMEINGFNAKKISEEDVRKARNASSDVNSEINIYFDIFNLDINNKVMLKVGHDNSSQGIYTTIYKEELGQWSKNHNEIKIHKAITKVSFPLHKKSWSYGYGIINSNIQLRNENLYEAKNKIDQLVDQVVKLVSEVTDNIQVEYINI